MCFCKMYCCVKIFRIKNLSSNYKMHSNAYILTAITGGIDHACGIYLLTPKSINQHINNYTHNILI